jgi:hypothetical protein
MAIDINTLRELTDKNLALLESALGQDSPFNDEAFIKILAAVLGLSESSLYKFGTQNALESLAATASLEGLKNIGLPYGVIFKEAQSAVLNIELPAVNGTVIPDTVIFTGDDNGVRYFPDNPATASGGVAALTVTAETPGANGNLDNPQTMTIDRQIAGAETVATVISKDTLGTEDENEQLFRNRVLNAIRRKAGGGNKADTRTWGEAVPGVAGIFPFTGRPFLESPELSVPPERTVYVEATIDIDPDGIAPPTLLDAVQAALQADPENGVEREKLGMTDEHLYVRSISRKLFYTEIRDLVTPAGQETEVQQAVTAAVETYYLSLKMFIEGLDFEGDKNNEITDLFLSKIVQDSLQPSGSSAAGVGFGTIPGAFEGVYILKPGELAKSPPGGVTFA